MHWTGSIIILSMLGASCVCTSRKCSYINYRGMNESKPLVISECPIHDVCGRTLNISHIDVPPYSTGHLFERIVEGCCGSSCTTFNLVKEYANISEVQLSDTTSSDFILPFLGKSSAVSLYGYHFIPFADVPHAYYITPEYEAPIKRMFRNCTGMYVLIILCLLAAVLSGFIIWTFEVVFGSKSESERQSFFGGVFEGFWWCFNAVTPGCGAKIIETLPAKLYTVVWILVGVLMFSVINSIFTAELMTILGKHTSGHSDSMAGEKVGVLKYRDYDASLVAREGGYVQETSAPNFHEDLLMLVRMLRNKEIDGMVLDKYTMAYANGYLKWKEANLEPHTDGEQYSNVAEDAKLKNDIEYFLTSTDSTLKEYYGDKLSYGVLVKKEMDFLFLDGAVRDNRLSLEAAVESEMNRVFPKKEKKAVMASLDDIPIKWICVIIGVLCALGVTCEFYQWFKKKNKAAFCSNEKTML